MFFVDTLRAVGDFFLPQVCLFCGNAGIVQGQYPVCERCLEGFIPLSPPCCPRCGIPLHGGPDAHLCGECIQNPPPFETARSLFAFDEKARDLIHALKFRGSLAALSIVDFLLREWIEPAEMAGNVDIIAPVPMDKKGLRRRGYNQALLMAECVAKILGVPVDRTHLVKLRETPPQVGLTRAERKRNISGAFSVTDMDTFKGKAVLLVDDVYTTGATVRSCTRTLLRGGARRVRVWTFARTVMG